MRIGWMHDYSLAEHPGGAQRTNEAMITNAPGWVEIVRCYPGRMDFSCDAYILNNVKFFSAAELGKARIKPYIVYEHDHWDTPQGWQGSWIRPLIERARAVVFLSPFHERSFCGLHGVRPRKSFLVPSPVDASLFNLGNGKSGTVWLGWFAPGKGVELAQGWAAENGPVDFYGIGDDLAPSGENVNLCGFLDYKDVPATMAKYERFLFLPTSPEPFGRTVAEAALSGCELICNGLVGALSWGYEGRDEWAEAVEGAPARFWGIVEEMLG